MKIRQIFLRFLAVIMILSLAILMTVAVSAEDGDAGYETETEADHEGDFVIRYEGESVFWYEGESLIVSGSAGEILYETNVVWMWVCACGTSNIGDSCSACGEEKPEDFIGNAFVVGFAPDADASTTSEKAGDLLGCSGTVSVGSVIAVVLAGACLAKRKKSDD